MSTPRDSDRSRCTEPLCYGSTTCITNGCVCRCHRTMCPHGYLGACYDCLTKPDPRDAACPKCGRQREDEDMGPVAVSAVRAWEAAKRELKAHDAALDLAEKALEALGVEGHAGRSCYLREAGDPCRWCMGAIALTAVRALPGRGGK